MHVYIHEIIQVIMIKMKMKTKNISQIDLSLVMDTNIVNIKSVSV